MHALEFSVLCGDGEVVIFCSLSGLPICYLSRGYLRPLLDVLGGIFTPPRQLRGYHSVFQAASPSQAMSEDSKSYFERSI